MIGADSSRHASFLAPVSRTNPRDAGIPSALSALLYVPGRRAGEDQLLVLDLRVPLLPEAANSAVAGFARIAFNPRLLRCSVLVDLTPPCRR